MLRCNEWAVRTPIVVLAAWLVTQVGIDQTGFATYGDDAIRQESQAVEDPVASEAAEPKPFAHIPATVSPPARGFLANVTPPSDGNPQSMEDWRKLRSMLDAQIRPLAEDARRAFGVKTKRSKIAGVDVLEITPRSYDAKKTDALLIYIHGGAYTLESAEVTLAISAPIADATGLKVIAVDYRLAPEHPFPAGLDDCLAVYRELLKKHSAGQIAMFGESAGGALALSTVLKAREEKVALPAALGLISPWADLTKTGDSYYTLENIAPVMHYERNLKASARAYAGKHDMKAPLLSPVYADYRGGFPPTLIQTGTRDLFLSNCARLQRRLAAADVEVSLSLWEGMWHVFQGDPQLPEAVAAQKELAAFLSKKLGHTVETRP